jgi:hypothetical protein
LTARSAAKKEGLEGDEGGRQDKRIVSAVVVIAHRHGTCSADIGASRQTKVIRKEEGKVKGTESVLLQLPAGPADAATCRLLDRLTFDSLAPQAPVGSSLEAGRKSSNEGGQGKRNQGALFVSHYSAMTWRNL